MLLTPLLSNGIKVVVLVLNLALVGVTTLCSMNLALVSRNHTCNKLENVELINGFKDSKK